MTDLTAAGFQKKYRALVAGFAREQANSECVECVACHGCHKSTFCQSSQRLINCHYCEDCTDSIESLHCKRSRGLIGCQHCTESEHCNLSSYLILCVSLSRSSYCLGCVGIANADYHILNEPYERRDYFRILQTLPQQLGSATSKPPLKRIRKRSATESPVKRASKER